MSNSIRNTNGKSFTISGQRLDFEFSENQINYNKWRLFYDSLATKCADKYLATYKSYGDLDKFAEKGFQDGWKIVGEALFETNQKSAFNVDTFINQYGESCFSDWIEAFFEVNDQYMEIVLKATELDAYRTQRRLNRGRFIGGGFGIEGAIKGIATAEALNIASGAIHGTFNLISKGLKGIGNASKKSKIYNNEKTKQTLWEGIYYSIFNMHYAICDILKIPLMNLNDIRSADALFDNLSRISEKDILEHLTDVIILNPYKVEAYEYWIEVFGDEEEDVKRMAAFFGVNANLIKTKLLNKVYSSLDLSSEQSTIKAKAIFEQYKVKYGLQNSTIPSPFLREINTKLQDFAKEARIVEGKEYSTRADAKKASEELKVVREIVSEFPDYLSNEISAKQLLGKLKSKKFKYGFEVEHIEEIKNVLKDMDLAARTYNKKVFETRELAKTAREEDTASKLEFKKIDKIIVPAKRGSEEDINKAIEAIAQSDFSEKNKQKALKDLESAKLATQFLEGAKKEREKKANFYIQRRYIPIRIIRFLIEIALLLLFIYVFFTTDILGKVITGILTIWMCRRWYVRKEDYDKIF